MRSTRANAVLDGVCADRRIGALLRGRVARSARDRRRVLLHQFGRRMKCPRRRDIEREARNVTSVVLRARGSQGLQSLSEGSGVDDLERKPGQLADGGSHLLVKRHEDVEVGACGNVLHIVAI